MRVFAATFFALIIPLVHTQTPSPYQDPTLPPAQRAINLVSRMTLLQFTLDPRWISEVDAEGMRSVQAGTYRLSIGGAKPNDPNAPSHTQIVTLSIDGNQALSR